MPDIQKENTSVDEQIKYLQDSLYVISGKWKLPILVAIHEGNTRFRDIQRRVNRITSKVLSKELKELELNKLIVRKVYNDSPPTVEYTTSNYCDSLQNVVAGLIEWGKYHREKIKED
ncbi:DNA-binding HxlR family transcriptional regulator [Flavobacterium sp. HSC-32F16]|uniref:winged helix-turn-helix transcriptional regulator n=1 Tax=Flavobacterium sp. HSC-32F16 TaxID=2910964 RepID=UPI0020A4EF3D|nr:helix-turn-helix domain-containing protein [Flavobacterium sp. HSC-32F16]MCP2028544.1 DNA-binding HxlR family transcriptional regulator [Flavobacterium sp. HSC-32F16]